MECGVALKEGITDRVAQRTVMESVSIWDYATVSVINSTSVIKAGVKNEVRRPEDDR
jgi:hypothetical protein